MNGGGNSNRVNLRVTINIEIIVEIFTKLL
jgi:hypothetical protein